MREDERRLDDDEQHDACRGLQYQRQEHRVKDVS